MRLVRRLYSRASLICLIPEYCFMEEDINALLEKIYAEKNIDFSGYKKSSLKRRIARRLEVAKVASIDAYLRLLDSLPREYEELLETMLIKETTFFRDPEVFEEIRKTVLPAILAGKKKGDAVRTWCAGCAMGEEAYSIAMLLAEARGFQDYYPKLYATDLSQKALKTARQGKYSSDKLKAVPGEMAAKYFPGGRVKEELRRMVIFGKHDLTSDPPISNLDLLLCRYTLMYFTSELQRKVFAMLHYALRRGGFLVIGRSETLSKNAEELFETFNAEHRIYHRL